MKVAAKPAGESVDRNDSDQAVPGIAEISRLKEALASCTQQMERIQKEFAARNQPAQSGPMSYVPGQHAMPSTHVQGGYGQQTLSPGVAPQVVIPTSQFTVSTDASHVVFYVYWFPEYWSSTNGLSTESARTMFRMRLN